MINHNSGCTLSHSVEAKSYEALNQLGTAMMPQEGDVWTVANDVVAFKSTTLPPKASILVD